MNVESQSREAFKKRTIANIDAGYRSAGDAMKMDEKSYQTTKEMTHTWTSKERVPYIQFHHLTPRIEKCYRLKG